MDRAAVVLPQPDSPTSPSVVPCLIWRLMPSTAFMVACMGWKSWVLCTA